MKIIVTALLILLSSISWAKEGEILQFGQQFDLEDGQFYEGDITELMQSDPNLKPWAVMYLVMKQTKPNAKARWLFEYDGLIDEAMPQQKYFEERLNSNTLFLSKQYKLTDYDDLADEIKDIGAGPIRHPSLTDSDQVRVYTRAIHWVPEYGSNQPAKLRYGIVDSDGLQVSAFYLFIGKGEKPRDLQILLNKKANLTKEEMQQQMRETRRDPENRFSMLMGRGMITLVVLFALIYLYWGTRRK